MLAESIKKKTNISEGYKDAKKLGIILEMALYANTWQSVIYKNGHKEFGKRLDNCHREHWPQSPILKIRL